MGGDDNGNEDYRKMQAEAEAKKQAARDALNLQFGVRPTGGTAPTRAAFTSQVMRPVETMPDAIYEPEGGSYYYGGASYGSQIPVDVFDQTGFDAATAKFQGRDAEADANKAARDSLYSTVRQNAFDAGSRKLSEARERAQRDTRFELFAKGLNGGSADIDQNALLGRTYNEGVLDLGAKADTIKNDLRGSDESTRLNLLQSIDAGMDQGSALSSALQQMSVNNDRAAANATGTSVGDLFGAAGLLYTDSQARKGRQLGAQDFARLFSTRSGGSGGGSSPYTGTLSSVGGP